MNTPQTIHMIFKTHLDVGFTDYARNVLRSYTENFIPAALDVAAELRNRGGSERFVWTTGSWLIYEYLEQADPAARARLEAAIAAGDIAWHGLPFTTHSELLDAPLFRFGLSLAQDLDRRYGRTTIAAKMTDVPGHTRAIVPLLAEAGIRFLHIGVNPSSTPPDVPPVFVWRSPEGAEVVVMYHKGSYGDLMLVPGTDDAIAFAHTGDNHGPQSAEDILGLFDEMRARFPGAAVIGSTLDAYAAKLLAVRDQLPVVTSELGDTWIHGAGTDPHKVAQFRELQRLRTAWLERGHSSDEPDLAAFSRRLLLVPEHTWGMDEKTHLDDYTHYDAAGLRELRAEERTRRFEASWAEQRAYIVEAVDALGDTDLAREAQNRLAALVPTPPDRSDYERVADTAQPFDIGPLKIAFDERTGAITHLLNSASGQIWATATNQLALLRYQLFGQRDYDRFRRNYSINKRETAVWSIPDFTKPGLAAFAPEGRSWLPKLAGLYRQQTDAATHFLLELGFDSDASEAYGCPRRFTLEMRIPQRTAELQMRLQWFGKPACRLPEALWFSFNPAVKNTKNWRLDKLGQQIDPLDVVRDGNRRLHGVGHGATWGDGATRFALHTDDAPLIAPGEPSLLNFTNRQPPMNRGVHVNLYNNVWGTNFPMWYEDDGLFRFRVLL